MIYVFRASGGTVYAGQHRARTGHDPRQWPKRGSGPLPDGYEGSGMLWPGSATAEWRILRVLPAASLGVGAAERRAIRLVRAVFRDRCVNVRGGGAALTGSRRLWYEIDGWRPLSPEERAAMTREGKRQARLARRQQRAEEARRLAQTERERLTGLAPSFRRRLNPASPSGAS